MTRPVFTMHLIKVMVGGCAVVILAMILVLALATIVPLDQVHVYFDIDERTVLRLRRLEQTGTIVNAMKEPVVVRISLADSDEFAIEGKVDFLDNQIDPATGTLRARDDDFEYKWVADSRTICATQVSDR